MLFVGLANAVYTILTSLLGFINIPGFPDDVMNNLNNYMTMLIDNGTALITFFVPAGIITVGLPLVLVVIFAEEIYDMVMWVLRKIPMLGIE